MLADCCKTILHDTCSEIQDGKSTSFWWLVTFWFEKGPDSRRAGTEERLPSWGDWISEGAEVCIMNERWSFLSPAEHYLAAGEAVVNNNSRVAYMWVTMLRLDAWETFRKQPRGLRLVAT